MIYDKRDDFDFDIVNFPNLDGDVSRFTSYDVKISQLIRLARVPSHVTDFNADNEITLLIFPNRAIGIINVENIFKILSPTL